MIKGNNNLVFFGNRRLCLVSFEYMLYVILDKAAQKLQCHLQITTAIETVQYIVRIKNTPDDAIKHAKIIIQTVTVHKCR